MPSRRSLHRAISVAASLLLLLLAAGTANAQSKPSWPARTEIVKKAGPRPYGAGLWKACAELRIGNPEGMVDGIWEGEMELDGGAAGPAPELVSFEGGAAFAVIASTKPLEKKTVSKYSIRGAEASVLAPGATSEGLVFCVAFKNTWAAKSSIQVRPAGADEYGVFQDESGTVSRYYVQVESDGASGASKHLLLRRQVGGFYADYSSGQVGLNCGCSLTMELTD